MTSSHYQSILCPCSNHKFVIRKTFLLDHKAMISTSNEWAEETQTIKHTNISEETQFHLICYKKRSVNEVQIFCYLHGRTHILNFFLSCIWHYQIDFMTNIIHRSAMFLRFKSPFQKFSTLACYVLQDKI